MSSYLRCYKLLNSKHLLHQTVQDLVVNEMITDAAQLAYKVKGNVIPFFNSDTNVLLPLDVYFQEI
jgi:hypothetical protein